MLHIISDKEQKTTSNIESRHHASLGAAYFTHCHHACLHTIVVRFPPAFSHITTDISTGWWYRHVRSTFVATPALARRCQHGMEMAWCQIRRWWCTWSGLLLLRHSHMLYPSMLSLTIVPCSHTTITAKTKLR